MPSAVNAYTPHCAAQAGSTRPLALQIIAAVERLRAQLCGHEGTTWPGTTAVAATKTDEARRVAAAKTCIGVMVERIRVEEGDCWVELAL